MAAIAIDPGAAEQRIVSPPVKEAQRLRNLGFYSKSDILYAQAVKEQPSFNLLLLVEQCAMHMEQGLMGLAFDKLSSAVTVIEQSDQEGVTLALFQMLRAATLAFTSVRFIEPLALAKGVFNEWLKDKPVEYFAKTELSLALLFHLVCEITKMVGFESDLELPSFTNQFWEELFNYLLREGRGSEALKVANLHASLTDPSQIRLTEELLRQHELPDLVRADALVGSASYYEKKDDSLQRDEQLKVADELYCKIGHAYGSLSIEAQILRRPQSEKDSASRIQRLLEIKSRYEDIGYFGGVREILAALYEVDMEAPDEELRTKLDTENLKLMHLRRCPIDWVSQSLMNLRRWDMTGMNVGKTLYSLESLYEDLSAMDMPVFLANVVTMLHSHYLQLGDSAKATEWASKRPDLLSRPFAILHGTEPFYKRLEALEGKLTADGIENEETLLQTDLDNVENILEKTTELDHRALEAMRLCNICQLYLNQHALRGLERTSLLVNKCLEAVDKIIPTISSLAGKQWKANAAQLKSRLLFIDANTTSLEDIPARIEILSKSAELQKNACDIYRSIGLSVQMALAQQQAGLCYDLIWQLRGKQSTSEDFQKAVACYDAAKGLLNKTGMLQIMKMSNMQLLKLWYQGLLSEVVLTEWFGLKKVSPLQMTLKCIEDAEAFATLERNDLSALKTQDAILAKQNLRKQRDYQEVYSIALDIHAKNDDLLPVWNLTQKSKARSVSDIMALGINLPEALNSQIEADENLKKMLTEETSIGKKIEQEATDKQFYLRRELEQHRKKMRRHPVLEEVLDLREGNAVTLEKLQDMQNLQQSTPDRKIVFVDWIVYGAVIIILVTSEGGPKSMKALPTNFTVEDGRKWKEDFLNVKELNHHPLDTADPVPLQQLSRLVSPLLEITKPGDILVFCPTDVLHGIPLHAATLGDGQKVKGKDAKTSIIERNPIIYTSSMTNLSHCISRELGRKRNGREITNKFISVLEVNESFEPLNDAEKVFRDKLYKDSNEIAKTIPGSQAITGFDATPTSFKDSFASDSVYFFGHCNYNVPNLLEQSLIIGPERGSSAIGEEMPIHSEYTVSNIFKTQIKTSNVILIACGSATQSLSVGDEPMGIVTALLCAGATSIIAGQWFVKVNTGSAFTSRLYENLQKDREKNGDASFIDMAVALQEVVKKMKKNHEFKSPFHWAPFVLHGSWFISR